MHRPLRSRTVRPIPAPAMTNPQLQRQSLLRRSKFQPNRCHKLPKRRRHKRITGITTIPLPPTVRPIHDTKPASRASMLLRRSTTLNPLRELPPVRHARLRNICHQVRPALRIPTRHRRRRQPTVTRSRRQPPPQILGRRRPTRRYPLRRNIPIPICVPPTAQAAAQPIFTAMSRPSYIACAA